MYLNYKMDNLKLYSKKTGQDCWDRIGVNKFPDGQIQLYNKGIDFKDTVCIANLTTPEDVHLLQQLTYLGLQDLKVYYSYGSRCDKDHYGEYPCVNLNSFMVDIYSQIPGECEILMPHGSELSLLLSQGVYNWRLARSPIRHLIAEVAIVANVNMYEPWRGKTAFVFPDESAAERWEGYHENVTDNPDRIDFKKERDQLTGEIKSLVPNSINKDYEHLVVFDDIIDGGRTFIETSNILKEKFPNAKLYLITTHSLFSAGYEGISAAYDHTFSFFWKPESTYDIPNNIHLLDASELKYWI